MKILRYLFPSALPDARNAPSPRGNNRGISVLIFIGLLSLIAGAESGMAQQATEQQTLAILSLSPIVAR